MSNITLFFAVYVSKSNLELLFGYVLYYLSN